MIILCYHELAESESNPWILSPTKFENHLLILKERGYHSACLNDTYYHEKTVIITFDDGRKGCIEHALSILESLEFTAIFYICPGFINNNVPLHESYSQFINWSDIRILDQHGHTIGSHGLTHQSFQTLSKTDRYNELYISKNEIEEQTGTECAHFAAPHGFVDLETSNLSRKIGYETVTTTICGYNKKPLYKYGLKRWQISPPCEDFEFKLDNLEKEALQFKVAIYQKDKCPLEKLITLAEHDLVICQSDDVHNTLSQFCINHIDCRKLDINIKKITQQYIINLIKPFSNNIQIELID